MKRVAPLGTLKRLNQKKNFQKFQIQLLHSPFKGVYYFFKCVYFYSKGVFNFKSRTPSL